jgi:hypothetical protein
LSFPFAATLSNVQQHSRPMMYMVIPMVMQSLITPPQQSPSPTGKPLATLHAWYPRRDSHPVAWALF